MRCCAFERQSENIEEAKAAVLSLWENRLENLIPRYLASFTSCTSGHADSTMAWVALCMGK